LKCIINDEEGETVLLEGAYVLLLFLSSNVLHLLSLSSSIILSSPFTLHPCPYFFSFFIIHSSCFILLHFSDQPCSDFFISTLLFILICCNYVSILIFIFGGLIYHKKTVTPFSFSYPFSFSLSMEPPIYCLFTVLALILYIRIRGCALLTIPRYR
jgi:hypothetical protein